MDIINAVRFVNILPYNIHIHRFIDAQRYTYDNAIQEITAGHKSSHWIWYVFPQPPFGRSDTSIKYSINSIDEARAYMKNTILRERYINALNALNRHHGMDIRVILGDVDASKLHASLTLFWLTTNDYMVKDIINKALNTFFKGKQHIRTIAWYNNARNIKPYRIF